MAGGREHGIAALVARVMATEDGRTTDRPSGPGIVPIAHVRPSPGRGTPVVLLPGGRGLGSLVPYRALRRRAVRRGLDVIMMEHRGVGLSRRLRSGDDLIATDVTHTDMASDDVTVEAAADDLAAVLDDRDVEKALIYGSSYGSYLAQTFAARHPGRVAAMILNSPMLSPAQDLVEVRAFRRGRLLHGPGRLPSLVRAVLDGGDVPVGEVGHVVQVVHEFAGPRVLEQLLHARLRGRGRRVWRRVAALSRDEIAGQGTPFVMEPDLVAHISYAQLGYAHAPDGLPLDPNELFARLVPEAPAFTGDPVDIVSALPSFRRPIAVISGERDLRTPRPIAERIISLAPDAVLVPLTATGHSALDTHQLAALTVARAVVAGRTAELPGLATHLSGLPRRGASGLLGPLLAAGVAVDAHLPFRPSRA